MENPWRRFRSMFRGPAAPVPPPTKPAPSTPPSTHPMIRLPTVKPTFRAASPPPRPEPRPQGEPVAVPPPPRETQPQRDPTAPPPLPPPAVTRAPTTGSVSQSLAPGPVAAAQVQVPAVSAAVAKHPMMSPRVSTPTSPIKTRTASTFSSTTTTPTPSTAAIAVPVPTSTMLSKPEVDARALPQSSETRLVTPLRSPLPEQEKVLVHNENAPPANHRHKHSGGGEVKGESAGETRRQGLSTGIVDAHKKVKDGTLKSKPPPLRAFVNSNVQGFNNSIVFDSSCTHHDPGVHLSCSRKPSFDTKGLQI